MTAHNRQGGLTLIELMVALLLASIVAVFVTNIMINSSRSARTSTGVTQAQEAGRLAMLWLGERIPHAGYRNTTFVFDVVDVNCVGTSFCMNDTDDNNNGGDVLALRRMANPDINDSPRLTQTCGGVNLPTSALNAPNGVIDVYWVERGDPKDPTTAFQLKCATYNTAGGTTSIIATEESIANGIESMQVLYGVESNSLASSGTVEQYVNGTFLKANPNMSARIVTIRVSLLSRSFENSSVIDGEKGYRLLDSDAAYRTDGVARYISTSTFWLPNMQNR